MLKSLFATCLTALSVNTQPLAVSPSLEPSKAITTDTTFNVGDIYLLSYNYDFTINTQFELFSNGDSGIDTLFFSSFSISSNPRISIDGFIPSNIDFAFFNLGLIAPSESYLVLQCDNADDDLETSIYFYTDDTNLVYTISLTFEILEGFEGFSTEALPYLTKVENPYTPPAKSNLYRLLYDFYYSIFNDDDLSAISTGYNMPFDNWLAHTCTIATLITLIVVAFFFLRWLFRVISGLVLLKR